MQNWSSMFSWNSQWLRREINVKCERVYELLTYSILFCSRQRGRKSEWMNRQRSKPGLWIALTILAYDFRFSRKKHGANNKNFYGICVDASLYFLEHCVPWNTLYFMYTYSRIPASVSTFLKIVPYFLRYSADGLLDFFRSRIAIYYSNMKQ